MPCPHSHAAGESCQRDLRAELPELPERMRKLPLDDRGFPVPWFVQFFEGKPDFRVMNHENFVKAVKQKRCWVCGDPLGRNMAFVAGPMCGINRTSAEPPAHLECAIFSAKGCPFLSRPKMRRNEKDLPPHGEMAGIGIMRNPGVAMVWVTRSYQLFRPNLPGAAEGTGYLFEIGPPEDVLWFAEGRPATRAEVMASVESGIHHLESLAGMEEGGMAHLEFCKNRFMKIVPGEENAG